MKTILFAALLLFAATLSAQVLPPAGSYTLRFREPFHTSPAIEARITAENNIQATLWYDATPHFIEWKRGFDCTYDKKAVKAVPLSNGEWCITPNGRNEPVLILTPTNRI